MIDMIGIMDVTEMIEMIDTTAAISAGGATGTTAAGIRPAAIEAEITASVGWDETIASTVARTVAHIAGAMMAPRVWSSAH